MSDDRIVDLHAHSNESDGTLSPEELVRAAKDAGLSAIALTDHDTAGGVARARAEAEKIGIEFVPGIELSTEFVAPPGAGERPFQKEVHVVGLFIDPGDAELSEKTREFRECRDGRNEKIVEALRREGFSITMEALKEENPDCVITRANIARYLIGHGEVGSVKEAFDKYLGEGKKCYVERFKISPEEAVRLIRGAGGIAILAHPMLYHLLPEQLRQLLCSMKEAGLTGLEAFYSTYTKEDEKFCLALAGELSLLPSGGSDFHGSNKPDISLGTGRGSLRVPYPVLSDLRGAWERQNGH